MQRDPYEVPNVPWDGNAEKIVEEFLAHKVALGAPMPRSGEFLEWQGAVKAMLDHVRAERRKASS